MRRIWGMTLILFSVSSAQAALIDRGEGFIYDDVLDVTWAQNANITGGFNTWTNQMAWAAGYSQTHTVYGTFDDWRLASMDVNGDDTIVNCSSASEVACRDNEYGYLFYQYGVTSSSPGLFTNVQGDLYWSGTEYAPLSSSAWAFDFSLGFQYFDDKENFPFYAWAVRAGDVAPVPVPAAVWLFGSALMGLLGVRRMRR